MPKTKAPPKRLNEAERLAKEQDALPGEGPKTLDMVRQERDEMMQNALDQANDQLASKALKKGTYAIKIKKPALKIQSLTKRKGKSNKGKSPKSSRSPKSPKSAKKKVVCPAGCIAEEKCRVKKTEGLEKEAKMLQELEGIAEELDNEPVMVLNPVTGKFEPLDADDAPTPKRPKSPKSPCLAFKTDPGGCDSAPGCRYVSGDKRSYCTSKPAAKPKPAAAPKAPKAPPRPKSPCLAYKADPEGCNSAPGCRYVAGEKRSYCTAKAAAPLPKLMPLAAAVPLAGEAPAGVPVAMAYPKSTVPAPLKKAPAKAGLMADFLPTLPLMKPL